jgi:hypothetical protein
MSHANRQLPKPERPRPPHDADLEHRVLDAAIHPSKNTFLKIFPQTAICN